MHHSENASGWLPLALILSNTDLNKHASCKVNGVKYWKAYVIQAVAQWVWITYAYQYLTPLNFRGRQKTSILRGHQLEPLA